VQRGGGWGGVGLVQPLDQVVFPEARMFELFELAARWGVGAAHVCMRKWQARQSPFCVVLALATSPTSLLPSWHEWSMLSRRAGRMCVVLASWSGRSNFVMQAEWDRQCACMPDLPGP
jgi:hypothetical protein